MRKHKHYKEPHQSKVPNAGLIKSAEDGCKPGELHYFCELPIRDSEEAGSRSSKIGGPLKGVVFCPEAGMPLRAPGQSSVGEVQVICGHLQSAANSAQPRQE
jgi:hypothetical protein